MPQTSIHWWRHRLLLKLDIPGCHPTSSNKRIIRHSERRPGTDAHRHTEWDQTKFEMILSQLPVCPPLRRQDVNSFLQTERLSVRESRDWVRHGGLMWILADILQSKVITAKSDQLERASVNQRVWTLMSWCCACSRDLQIHSVA